MSARVETVECDQPHINSNPHSKRTVTGPWRPRQAEPGSSTDLLFLLLPISCAGRRAIGVLSSRRPLRLPLPLLQTHLFRVGSTVADLLN